MNNTERCPRGHERPQTVEFNRVCETCGLAYPEPEWATANPEQRYANRLEAAHQDIRRWRKRAESAEDNYERLNKSIGAASFNAMAELHRVAEAQIVDLLVENERLRKEIEKWKKAAELWQMEAEANEEEIKNWMKKAGVQ